MEKKIKNENIVVVGAGVSGLGTACFLAIQGYCVEVLEKRTEREMIEQVDGRSINFTISEKGLCAFKKIGVVDFIKKASIPLIGRSVHNEGSSTSFEQAYGDPIYSIPRHSLFKILLKKAREFSNIKISFGIESFKLNKDNGSLHLIDGTIKKTKFVIGADGAFSAVRTQMLKGLAADFTQKFFDWNYKEIILSKEEVETCGFRTDHIHVWGTKECLLVGIPNKEKSMSLMFLHRRSIVCHSDKINLLKKAAMGRIKDVLANKLDSKASNWLTQVQLEKWHYKNKVVLLGDAAHAIYPFYGQGMNSAMEDAVTLVDSLKNTDSVQDAFSSFELKRKQETDAIAILSEQHFYELKDNSKSLFAIENSFFNAVLSKIIPKIWPNSYQLVVSKNSSYLKARKILFLKRVVLVGSGLMPVEAVVRFISFQMLNLFLRIREVFGRVDVFKELNSGTD